MNRQSPLVGKRIVVTRARHQAGPLEALIREFGASPVSYPCIAIIPPADPSALDCHLRNLRQFDWLALSSSNAARAVADRARNIERYSSLTDMRIAALGPATNTELRRHIGRGADFIPTGYSAESLARELPLDKPCRILLPQSDLADSRAEEILKSRGADVTAVEAYRTIVGRGGADLPAMIGENQIDALTFASPSAVRFFRQRCSAPQSFNLPALCLGPSTAFAARAQGFQEVITPPLFSLRAMIIAFSEYCAS